MHPHWRLVSVGSSPLLVPPDIKNPQLSQRVLKSTVSRGSGSCQAIVGIPVEVHGKRARVSVTASELKDQPPGTLTVWASSLEASGCLSPGEGLKLAARVAEAIPLDPGAQFRLLNADTTRSGEIGLATNGRLQVVSPYWKQPGIGMMEGPVGVTAESNAHLTVTGRYTENLLGEETSVYALQPKPGGTGSAITPLYANVRLADDTSIQRHAQPAVNYFQFRSDAAYYRLFQKTSETHFTGLMISAPTPAELDRRAKTLESAESPSCDLLPARSCIALPKDIAVMPMISVTINGNEVLVPPGSRLAGALLASGQRTPASVLPTLHIAKPWKGRAAPVIFDPTSDAVLSLSLLGGETITYTQR